MTRVFDDGVTTTKILCSVELYEITMCDELEAFRIETTGAGSSETLVPIYQITSRHIPKDSNLSWTGFVPFLLQG
jgi:hypothetical protein